MKENRLLSLINFLEKYSYWLFLFVFIYAFTSIFFGIDFADAFYHLNLPVVLEGNEPFVSLGTSFILKGAHAIFQESLIYYRIFNLLIVIGTILVPAIFLSDKSNRKQLVLYSSVLIVLLVPFNYNAIGYSWLSAFFISISLTYFLRNKKKDFTFSIILGLIFALILLIRLPNIYVLGIYMLYMVGVYFSKKESLSYVLKNSVIVLITCSILYFIILTIYYGSVNGVLQSYEPTASHNFKSLFFNYFRDFLKVAAYTGMFFSIFLFKRNKFTLIIYGVIFMTIIFEFVYRTPYVWQYSLFISSFLLFLSFNSIFKDFKNKYGYLILVLLAFTIPFGSNTGLLKFIMLIPAGFIIIILNSEDEKAKKLFYGFALILLPFSFMENLLYTYQDKALIKCQETINVKGLEFIRTNSERAEKIENVNALVKQLIAKGYHVEFYGHKSHIFTFLYPSDKDNYTFLQKIENFSSSIITENKLVGKPIALIILADEEFSFKKIDGTNLKNKLSSIGYKKNNSSSIPLYLPSN